MVFFFVFQYMHPTRVQWTLVERICASCKPNKMENKCVKKSGYIWKIQLFFDLLGSTDTSNECRIHVSDMFFIPRILRHAVNIVLDMCP